MRKAEALCAVLIVVLSLMIYVGLALWVIGDTELDVAGRFFTVMIGLMWELITITLLLGDVHKDLAELLFEEDDR